MKRRLIIAASAFISTILIADGAYALTLKEAIDLALKSNDSIHVSKRTIEKDEASLKSARGALLPAVKLGYRYTHAFTEPAKLTFFFPNVDAIMANPMGKPTNLDILTKVFQKYDVDLSSPDSTSLDVTLSQPLFVGGALVGGYRIAGLSVERDTIEASKTSKDIISKVVEGYFGILKLTKAMEVLDSTRKLVEQSLSDTQRLYVVGIVDKLTVLKLQVALLQIDQAHAELDNGMKLARSGFRMLVGLNGDAFTLVENVAIDISDIDLDAALQKGQERREELRSLAIARKQASIGVDIAKGQLLPSLVLAGQYSKPTGSSLQTESTSVSLIASWNIWDWGKTWYQADSGKAGLMALDSTISQVRKGVGLEIENAYLTLGSLRKKLVVQGKLLASAQESYRMTNEKFLKSVATTTDLLDSLNSLNKAKSDLYAAELDYQYQNIVYMKAVGENIAEKLR